MFFRKAKAAAADHAAEIAQARAGAREVVSAMKERRATGTSRPPTPARELEDELDGRSGEPTIPPRVVSVPKPR